MRIIQILIYIPPWRRFHRFRSIITASSVFATNWTTLPRFQFVRYALGELFSILPQLPQRPLRREWLYVNLLRNERAEKEVGFNKFPQAMNLIHVHYRDSTVDSCNAACLQKTNKIRYYKTRSKFSTNDYAYMENLTFHTYCITLICCTQIKLQREVSSTN